MHPFSYLPCKPVNFVKEKDVLYVSSIFLLFSSSALQGGTVPVLGVVSAAGNQAEFGSRLHVNPGKGFSLFYFFALDRC